jgi:multidrug efflux pump subunit AcrA (membrane-fusion protein)
MFKQILKWSLGVAVVAGLVGGAWLARDAWSPLFRSKADAGAAEEHDYHDRHDHGKDRVRLSPQARANLRLDVQPAIRQSYWRTLSIPGIIVDRPGVSDRGVTSPIAGVVTQVHAKPGDTVKPGDPLFELRLISEYVQNAQTELFKNTKEMQLVEEQKSRLVESVRSGAVSEARMIEVDNQLRRLTTAAQAYRQDLIARGLSPEQVKSASEGKFVREVTLRAPKSNVSLYEVQELKATLGEQVQAGQVLSILSNHQELYIEGHGFKQEANLLERAAREGWAVQAEFAEDAPGDWPPLHAKFSIHHLANTVDPTSRTLAFYLPLVNQSRSYEKYGQTFLVWRFRPGQRVRLQVPIEEFKDVFVLPTAAIVREGAETFVFRQNGDFMERKPVRVLYEDRANVAIANDGGISDGLHIARHGAAALNRAIKAQSGGHEHGHDHGHEH